jgi:hypothetical protein
VKADITVAEFNDLKQLKDLAEWHAAQALQQRVPNGYWPINPKLGDWHDSQSQALLRHLLRHMDRCNYIEDKADENLPD